MPSSDIEVLSVVNYARELEKSPNSKNSPTRSTRSSRPVLRYTLRSCRGFQITCCCRPRLKSRLNSRLRILWRI
ncbi:unnamed protein product [Rhizoctonia solani]|uniref:Uncharacterized protein n=1 Tax=Rhizoctonia solani TaxID=456999 RepID=A0A8H2WKE9_9AGAM|nr:unnamed protein product [Rhizoctonia solani]